TQLPSEPAVTSIPCFDLPISGALIAPSSCWQTGPTSVVVAGTSPTSPSTGAVAVVDGQAQRLTKMPKAGPVRILSSGTAAACAQAASGAFYLVDLADGEVGVVPRSACAPSNSPSVTPPPATGPPSTSGPAPNVQNAASLPPTVSPSYYEYYAFYSQDCSRLTSCPLYQQGQTTVAPSPNGLVVLDFGSPCYVANTSIYGVEMFFTPICVPDTTVRGLVGDWIAGYESDHGPGTPPLTLAAGTSNSLNGIDPNYQLTDPQMQASGQAWYQQLVGAISTSGLAAPLVIWGASDMEQASDGNWYAGTPSVDWATGYGDASPAHAQCHLGTAGYLVDYGDDILGGSGSADGWTVAQVYQVAWGLPAACALPEIYYSGMAPEWAALSQWGAQNSVGGPITFSGVMTENAAGSYSPQQGWEQLQGDTGQSPPIPTVTEIAWSLQGQPPQVTAVTPGSGPPAGGTQVTIGGVNLLGTQAVYFGSTPASSFTVTGNDTISATAPAGAVGFVDVQVVTALGTSPADGSDGFLYTGDGAYHPLTPARIADTRPGSGLPGSGDPVGPGQTVNIQVSGVGGVPSSGAVAVMVNLTVTDVSLGGYATAFPTGVAVPPSSSIDFSPGENKANLVEVALGRSGEISVYEDGTAQLVVDVEGWLDASGATSGPGLFNALTPARIADTRPGSGEPYADQTLGPGQSLQVQVAGKGGIPASGAAAVVFNLTATDPSTYSYLTVYPSGQSQPLASNLNFATGETIANQVVVEPGSRGKVTIYNAVGSVDVVVDVAGWYGDGSQGATAGGDLFAMVPRRAADTRPGSGQPYAGQTLGPGHTLTLHLPGSAGLPASGVSAVVLNVTVTDGTAPGYLQAWPSSATQPLTSEVNWLPGQSTENLVMVGLGSSGAISLYNGSSGSVDVIVDVEGWYAAA
ncbi:MAG: IPT/TIG domain-containing protein, partial [Candidatus Dormibacteria bacterium]